MSCSSCCFLACIQISQEAGQVVWYSHAGKDWGQEKKGTTEDEMAGWHHWLDGHESEWTPGVGDGQGGLACRDSWGHKELDTTERLNWTELNWTELKKNLRIRKSSHSTDTLVSSPRKVPLEYTSDLLPLSGSQIMFVHGTWRLSLGRMGSHPFSEHYCLYSAHPILV